MPRVWKVASAAACKFGKRRDQREGWNKTPGERRRGLNRWEMGQREPFYPRCGERMGGVWITLLTCESGTPGLHDFSDSWILCSTLHNSLSQNAC